VKKFLAAIFTSLLTLLFVTSVFAQTNLSGKVIVLDPGHGGSDTGAVNGTLYEKDVTLDIANRLKLLLEADGATVYLTRDCDCDKSNNDRYTLANSVGGNALVSIHFNGSTNSTKDGTQGLWGKKNKDQAFTKIVHQALAGSLGVPDLGITNFASGVLLKSNMPSTIAETIFITNTNEYNLLTDGTGNRQQQIAQSLYQGIINWFSNPPPSTRHP
jgi:N-acetylmuramoyl-L-alanine amidase